MVIQFHLIWREQIAAVSAIRSRHGEDAAFDYIVDEKLMNYAKAAEDRPEFARELPRFVAAIRDAFPPDTMSSGLQRLAHNLDKDEASATEALREKEAAAQREPSGRDTQSDEDDLEDAEDIANQLQAFAAKRRRFNFLRELLLSDRLGTA